MNPPDTELLRNKMRGLVIGMAVGDALGLPFEGISPGRIGRMLRNDDLGHRFILGRGMISDDTEHLCMTAQALLESQAEPAMFRDSLARRLRWWLAGLPAGIGLGTLRALVKLWLGFGPGRSGVFTAGNGPAMRSPIIGAAITDPEQLSSLVTASTRITHTDPKACHGAMAIALSAREAVYCSQAEPGWPEAVLDRVTSQIADPELVKLLQSIPAHLDDKSSVADFARDLGISNRKYRGVSGYMYHTVPAAIFAWLRYPGDYRSSIKGIISAGGDTDTTAAITGALAGAAAGASGIPGEWIDGMADWPRSVKWMVNLADRLAVSVTRPGARPLPLFWPGLIPRNILFMVTVLVHGVRRMLPPY
jgi:ADP-ribosylglycohydrolase